MLTIINNDFMKDNVKGIGSSQGISVKRTFEKLVKLKTTTQRRTYKNKIYSAK